MDYRQNAVEAAAAKTVYASSGAAVLLGMTANELAAIGGLIVAFLALIINAGVNIYFKSQHLKLARKKAALADGGVGDDD